MATRLAKKMITGSAAIAKVLARGFLSAGPEQEFGALVGIAEQVGDSGRQPLDHGPAAAGVEHEEGDRRLQRERRADDAQADRLAVRGQQIGKRQDGGDPDDAQQLLIHWGPRPSQTDLYQTMPCVAADAASSSSFRASSGFGHEQLLAPLGDMNPLVET